MPNLLSKVKSKNIHNATSDRLWIRGASPSYVFKDLLQQLTQDLKVFAVQPEAKAHMPEFCQMLSKVAYSFAAAEFGFNNFIPFVIPYIIDANLKNCGNCIGSLKNEEPPSDHLHELSIDKDAKYITVRVRLLAKLGTPTYYVVVGEHYNKGE